MACGPAFAGCWLLLLRSSLPVDPIRTNLHKVALFPKGWRSCVQLFQGGAVLTLPVVSPLSACRPQSDEFARVQEPLFRQISRCLTSSHFQVRASLCWWLAPQGCAHA